MRRTRIASNMVSSAKPLLSGVSGPASRLFSVSVLDSVFFEDTLVGRRGSRPLEIQTVREWLASRHLLRRIVDDVTGAFERLFQAHVTAPTEETALSETLDTLNSTSAIEGKIPVEVSKKTIIRKVRDLGTFLDAFAGGRPWNKAPRKLSDFTSVSKSASPFVRSEKGKRSFWEKK